MLGDLLLEIHSSISLEETCGFQIHHFSVILLIIFPKEGLYGAFSIQCLLLQGCIDKLCFSSFDNERISVDSYSFLCLGVLLFLFFDLLKLALGNLLLDVALVHKLRFHPLKLAEGFFLIVIADLHGHSHFHVLLR